MAYPVVTVDQVNNNNDNRQDLINCVSIMLRPMTAHVHDYINNMDNMELSDALMSSNGKTRKTIIPLYNKTVHLCPLSSYLLGYARRKHRDSCRKVVSIVVSIRVDKIYERKVVWDRQLSNHNSEPYQHLSYESLKAVRTEHTLKL